MDPIDDSYDVIQFMHFGFQNVIHNVFGQNSLPYVIVQHSGEDDGWNVLRDDEIHNLAIGRIRKIQVQDRYKELIFMFTDGILRMTIRDNGSGFKLQQSIGDQAILGKLGLVGMRERARLLGGTMTLDSIPGKGTTIVVEVRV